MAAADSLIGEGLAPSPYAEALALLDQAAGLLAIAKYYLPSTYQRREELLAKIEEKLK